MLAGRAKPLQREGQSQVASFALLVDFDSLPLLLDAVPELALDEAEEDLDSDFESPPPPSASFFARFFCLSFLKSVSYQPLPFSRKAGADNNFRMPS